MTTPFQTIHLPKPVYFDNHYKYFELKYGNILASMCVYSMANFDVEHYCCELLLYALTINNYHKEYFQHPVCTQHQSISNCYKCTYFWSVTP